MSARPRAKTAAQASSGPTVHSIAGLLKERTFAGDLGLGEAPMPFTYALESVAVRDGRIVLTGAFWIGPDDKKATQTDVHATLASTQGEIGQAPRVRRELLAALSQGNEEAEPDTGLPITEMTGHRGFVGVMYFKLSPIGAQKSGIAADMHDVQLNARLSPTSDVERDLQWLFSGLVMAVHGDPPDAARANSFVDAINHSLKG